MPKAIQRLAPGLSLGYGRHALPFGPQAGVIHPHGPIAPDHFLGFQKEIPRFGKGRAAVSGRLHPAVCLVQPRGQPAKVPAGKPAHVLAGQPADLLAGKPLNGLGPDGAWRAPRGHHAQGGEPRPKPRMGTMPGIFCKGSQEPSPTRRTGTAPECRSSRR